MKHQCVMCDKWFDEETITFAPDPFSSEINDDDTPVWECDDCREERKDEI